MKTCYLIHGIETSDSKRSTISFLKYTLSEFNVETLSYGYVPVILAFVISFLNFFFALRLKRNIAPGQILIGHSNGCALAYDISSDIETLGLVLINPALDNDVVFDPRLAFVHIYWSRNDEVTWLSKYIPFSKWGSMGAEGYKGEDARVMQWDMGTSHNGIASDDAARYWGPIIAGNLLEAISRHTWR